MSTVIIVVGLLIIVIGLIVFLRKPPLPDPPPELAEGPLSDLKGVLEALLKILEKFDKRYLPGIFVMLVGLSLVGLGVFLEARDAKDAVDTAGAMLLAPGLLRLRQL